MSNVIIRKQKSSEMSKESSASLIALLRNNLKELHEVIHILNTEQVCFLLENSRLMNGL